MALNPHNLTLTTGWLALMWLHRYNPLTLFGLGHSHHLLSNGVSRSSDIRKGRLLGSTGWTVLLPDLLLDGSATGLLQSRRAIDCIAKSTTIDVTSPTRLSVMVLNAGLDRGRLADVNYLVMRCVGRSEYCINTTPILQ